MSAALAAAQLYRELRMGGVLPRGRRPAILVVDLQRGFTDPAYAAGAELGGVVQSTRALLDAARGRGLPIVFTVIAYEPNLRDLGIWGRKIPGLGEMRTGSEAVELDPRLGRRDDEPLVEKCGASAIPGTGVLPLLLGAGADSAILCGATTSGCIRATAIDLMEHRVPTVVPRECVGDRAQAPHDANLFDIHAKYADVISLEDALAYVASVEER